MKKGLLFILMEGLLCACLLRKKEKQKVKPTL